MNEQEVQIKIVPTRNGYAAKLYLDERATTYDASGNTIPEALEALVSQLNNYQLNTPQDIDDICYKGKLYSDDGDKNGE